MLQALKHILLNFFVEYSKTGICRAKPIFLIFAPKLRLWVLAEALVRSASSRRFYRVPTMYVLSKNKKNIKIFLLKIFIFYNLKNSILQGHVFVMSWTHLRIFSWYFQTVWPYLHHELVAGIASQDDAEKKKVSLRESNAMGSYIVHNV